jgi:hypothetical protein
MIDILMRMANVTHGGEQLVQQIHAVLVAGRLVSTGLDQYFRRF